jgi:hypothetical protein
MGGPIGSELVRRVNLFVNALIPVGHRRRKVSQAEMAHYRGTRQRIALATERFRVFS